jgi:predicted metalloprotease with PDZ domain
MSKPWTHLLEVEMRIRFPATATVKDVDLIMPVWTPGSYVIREFERNVGDFAADTDGRALEWTKVNKNTWRVRTDGARVWRATYRVYANEFSVRTSELNADHAFWNNAGVLMYPDKYLDRASTLHIEPAAGWKTATALPPVAGLPNTFRAKDFDMLYDSPVECSNFTQVDFAVRGVPHLIVIDGQGNYDPERVRREVQKIVETEVEMMGAIPYHDYTFFLHLRESGGNGIEHLNSASLDKGRFAFSSDDDYREFAGLVAHEFFHLWNGKRIRPDALGPFDYTKENYTKLLWVVEGLTDYYADMFLVRAGYRTPRDYLGSLGRGMRGLQSIPGRRAMSVEEASLDAWTKFYRPDENADNSQVSYYAKGSLLGTMLDLEIRRRTSGAKSLDDVMRHLYREFYEKNRNYSPADFQRACETVSGSSLEMFFARYVRGREELDYNEALSAAGLTLAPAGGSPRPERSYFGATLAQQGERVIVRNVVAGSPAYEQGVNTGDWIAAIDGLAGSQGFFQARLDEKKPGEVVRLTVFRANQLRTIDVKLGSRSVTSFRILAVEKPTDEQKRVYEAWLGAPFPK